MPNTIREAGTWSTQEGNDEELRQLREDLNTLRGLVVRLSAQLVDMCELLDSTGSTETSDEESLEEWS